MQIYRKKSQILVLFEELKLHTSIRSINLPARKLFKIRLIYLANILPCHHLRNKKEIFNEKNEK